MTDAGHGGRLVALLLAAGAASRFGAAKQLATVDGVPLVVRAVRALAPVCEGGVLVVTGAYQEDIARTLVGESARCVYNPAWREGMAASIRQGIAAIGASADAVLLAVADQPGLRTQDYAELVAAWRGAPAQPAAAVYAGAPGVPAIFPRGEFTHLTSLQGDRGARSLLRSAAAVTRVELPAAAWDVDRPADLDRHAS
jgi:molybdenum cofactor cytidylyltransferase